MPKARKTQVSIEVTPYYHRVVRQTGTIFLKLLKSTLADNFINRSVKNRSSPIYWSYRYIKKNEWFLHSKQWVSLFFHTMSKEAQPPSSCSSLVPRCTCPWPRYTKGHANEIF